MYDFQDLVACFLFSDGVLWPLLLDNNTPDLKLFLKLKPVNISIPDIPDKSLACSSISVHFYEWYIAVQMKLYDSNNAGVKCEQLYIFNLFGDELPDRVTE